MSRVTQCELLFLPCNCVIEIYASVQHQFVDVFQSIPECIAPRAVCICFFSFCLRRRHRFLLFLLLLLHLMNGKSNG